MSSDSIREPSDQPPTNDGRPDPVQEVVASNHSSIRGVIQGREVIGNIISTGDHSQFFIGGYERLRDAYIDPQSVFRRVDLDRFEGREWLLILIDLFLSEHDQGYFILEAEAGLGKSTFMAWLARERSYIHHFVELAAGMQGIEAGLKNLAAQLELAYGLNADGSEGILPPASSHPQYLMRLLSQAADQRREGEKIVLVVDALDESDTPLNQNVMGLPRALPEGVFFIVSQRPVPVTLQVDLPTERKVFRFHAESRENQDDMRRFLEKTASWPGVSRALRESGHTPQHFITTLLEKCHGLWIYLHFVVFEIEDGDASPLNLNALPDGMAQYYARYWKKWRDKDEEQWYRTYLPLLATLAASQVAITAVLLAEWAGVKMPELMLRKLLNENWRPFMTISGQGAHTSYRFYHASLREFFQGQVKRKKLDSSTERPEDSLGNLTAADESILDELATETRRAHYRLVERYLTYWGGLANGLPDLMKDGRRLLDEGYGLRYLPVHLEAAGRVADLHRLLALENEQGRNTWYQAKDAADELTSYLLDIVRTWRLMEEDSGSHENVTGMRIALECRYALILSSLNSLTSSIPPSLLSVLLAKGLWQPPKVFAYAQQFTQPSERVKVFINLARNMPSEYEEYKNEALRKALHSIPEAKEGGGLYWRVLIDIVQELPDSLLKEALEIARANPVGPWVFVKFVCKLPNTLREEILPEALQAVLEMDSEFIQAEALADLAPHLSEPLRSEILQQALLAARANDSEAYKAERLINLSSHLLEPLRSQVLGEAQLAAARAMFGYVSQLIRALTVLGPALSEASLKSELETLREKGGENQGAVIQAVLTQNLPDSEQEEAVRQALTATGNATNKLWRLEALAVLIPQLAQLGHAEEALTRLRTVDGDFMKASILAATAPHLELPALQDAISDARQIRWNYARALALATLLVRLAELGFSGEALTLALEEDIQACRGEALIGLAPYLSDAQVERSLPTLQTLEDEADRAAAQSVLLARLAALGHCTEAIEMARVIPNNFVRAMVLAAVLPFLTDADRKAARQDVWNIAAALPGQFRAKVLMALAVYLPDAEKKIVLRRALQETLAFKNEQVQAWCLEVLSPITPALLLQEFLPKVRKIKNARWRTDALLAMAPYLSDAERSQALEAVKRTAQAATRRHWADYHWPIVALARLALLSSEPAKSEVVQEVLQAVKSHSSSRTISDSFANIAEGLPARLLTELWLLLREEKNMTAKTDLLGIIASRLGGPHQDEMLREVLSKAWIKFDYHSQFHMRLVSREELEQGYSEPVLPDISRLATSLNEPILREAIDSTGNLRWDYARSKALAALVPRLAKLGRGEEALGLVGKIDYEKWRVPALAQMAVSLPDELKSRLLEEVRELKHEHWRTQALEAVIPHLPPALLETVLADELGCIRPEEWLSEAVAGFALLSTEPERARLLQEALEYARALPADMFLYSPRVNALTNLVDKLPESERPGVIDEAIAVAQEVVNDFYRGETLVKLTNRLIELGYPEKALLAVQATKPDDKHIKALAHLSLFLPEPQRHELLAEALEVVRAERNPYQKAKMVVELAARLPDSLKSEALHIAGSIKGEYDQANALMALVSSLPEELVNETLALAQRMKNKAWEALVTPELNRHSSKPVPSTENLDTLAEWADHSNFRDRCFGQLSESMFREALATAEHIEDEHQKAELLTKLAQYLPESELDEALSIALRIKGEVNRANALRGLAPYLAENLLRAALEATELIEEELWQSHALRGLLPRLAKLGYIAEALVKARKVYWYEDRADILMKLASQLEDPYKYDVLNEVVFMIKEGVDDINRVENLYERIRELVEMDYSPVELFKVARAINFPEWRIKTMAVLVPYLLNLPHNDLHVLWQESLHLATQRIRSSLLGDISTLTPIIWKLGGTEAVALTLNSIHDVERWWP